MHKGLTKGETPVGYIEKGVIRTETGFGAVAQESVLRPILFNIVFIIDFVERNSCVLVT